MYNKCNFQWNMFKTLVTIISMTGSFLLREFKYIPNMQRHFAVKNNTKHSVSNKQMSTSVKTIFLHEVKFRWDARLMLGKQQYHLKINRTQMPCAQPNSDKDTCGCCWLNSRQPYAKHISKTQCAYMSYNWQGYLPLYSTICILIHDKSSIACY